jgi:hypothetical protein
MTIRLMVSFQRKWKMIFRDEYFSRVKLHVARLKFMRFQVLTAARMNMRAFWDVRLSSLVEVDHHRPDDGSSTHL